MCSTHCSMRASTRFTTTPLMMCLKALYESGKWANDLDPLTFTGKRFHQSLRYAENHDEVRLASPKEWGGLGMKVGKPVSAVLFAMGRGPVMLYHGQEVGEPAAGEEGFGGDDARTSIFDYWSMPEFCQMGERRQVRRRPPRRRNRNPCVRGMENSSAPRRPRLHPGRVLRSQPRQQGESRVRQGGGRNALPVTGCMPSSAAIRRPARHFWWSRISMVPRRCAA